MSLRFVSTLSALLFSALIITAPLTAKAQTPNSEAINATNLLRGLLPASEVPSCALFSKYGKFCPAVASNCPGAYPTCVLHRETVRRRVRVSCKCADGIGAGATMVQPCPRGSNNCTVTPVTTSSTTTSSTRTTTTTSTTMNPASLNAYLEAQNNRTGALARNGQTLDALAGDTIQYRWGANTAVNGRSNYKIVSGSHSCSWPATGNWVVDNNMGGGGGQPATVEDCQKGATYEITYEPVNAAGQKLTTVTVRVRVAN